MFNPSLFLANMPYIYYALFTCMIQHMARHIVNRFACFKEITAKSNIFLSELAIAY